VIFYPQKNQTTGQLCASETIARLQGKPTVADERRLLRDPLMSSRV
jgi:hypothetical protein